MGESQQTETPTEKNQEKWTRIRPLQRDEMDPYTEAGMMQAELTWGRFPNNLCKVMAYVPRLMQTEVEYANCFIFDAPTYRGTTREAGFNRRFLKELVTSKTSLINRSWHSITDHSFIGRALFKHAGREKEGQDKLLHLHDHRSAPKGIRERNARVLATARGGNTGGETGAEIAPTSWWIQVSLSTRNRDARYHYH